MVRSTVSNYFPLYIECHHPQETYQAEQRMPTTPPKEEPPPQSTSSETPSSSSPSTSDTTTAEVHLHDDSPDSSDAYVVPVSSSSSSSSSDSETDPEDNTLLPVISSTSVTTRPPRPPRTKSCKRSRKKTRSRSKSLLYAFGSSHRRDTCPYCSMLQTDDDNSNCSNNKIQKSSKNKSKKTSRRHGNKAPHNGLPPEMTSRADDIQGIYHQRQTPVHVSFREKMEQRISQLESMSKEKAKAALGNSPSPRSSKQRSAPKTNKKTFTK